MGCDLYPGPACFASIHLAKDEQQQGVNSSEEHVRQPHLSEERSTGGTHGVSLTSSPS